MTLLIGDFLLVNKYCYGIRLPVVHKKIIEIGKPQRGDIIVLRWPPDPSFDFIKRDWFAWRSYSIYQQRIIRE